MFRMRGLPLSHAASSHDKHLKYDRGLVLQVAHRQQLEEQSGVCNEKHHAVDEPVIVLRFHPYRQSESTRR
jgi:hypothetical protein